MSISSPGVGSGLDVNSIVSQLVAIEKQPLQPLYTKANTYQSQLSLYGTLKSQMSTLEDAATALATSDGWASQKATSSNASAVSVSAGSTAVSTSFGLEVTNLALAQTTASKYVATGSGLGATGESGALTIELGSWTSGSFAGAAVPVTATITGINGDDSMTVIAGKINAANAGVTATVLRSGTQEKLVFRSSTTGEAAGFKISSNGGFAGLNALSFTGLANGSDSSDGMEKGQLGIDALAKLNGVVIKSATNTLTDVVPGVTLKLNQVTTSPVDIAVAQDTDVIQTKIQAFADAYSAVSKTLGDSTRYVAGGTSGVLQGDSTTVGLQSVLRSILGSSSVGSTYSRLSDVGLEQQTDGSLKLNAAKLTTAMGDMTNLQKLFTTDNGNASTNGFGMKMRTFAHGMLAADGTVTNKTTSIQGSITRNAAEQDRVNEHATRVEAQLRKQYSALDVQMAKMSALGSYVTAQLAQWNKTA